MPGTADFVRRFREIVAADGWRRRFSPTEVVGMWEQFVAACEAGYDDNMSEFENDLSIRDLIDHVMNHRDLQSRPEMTWFRDQVNSIDARYRSLLQADAVKDRAGAPWWRAYIPAFAGAELAADLASRYGVEVAVRE